MRHTGMVLAAGGLLTLVLASVSEAQFRVDRDRQAQEQQRQQQAQYCDLATIQYGPRSGATVSFLLVNDNAYYGDKSGKADKGYKQDYKKADRADGAGAGGTVAGRHESLRAKDLTGKNIENSEGDKLADIDDFVVDPGTGEVLYVVTRQDAVLGMGGRYIAIPWQALDYSAGRDAFVLNMTKDRLKNAPSFSPGDWPDMTNPAWRNTVDRYFGVQGAGADIPRGSMGRMPADGAGTGGTVAARQHTIRADHLTGKGIENPEGKRMVRIDDFVVDTTTGRVLYVVAREDTVLGLGGRYIAIPWQALDYNTSRDAFVLNMTEDRLKNAPSFSPGDWPDMTNPSWQNTVNRYYGVQTSGTGMDRPAGRSGVGGSIQQESDSLEYKHGDHMGDHDMDN